MADSLMLQFLLKEILIWGVKSKSDIYSITLYDCYHGDIVSLGHNIIEWWRHDSLF